MGTAFIEQFKNNNSGNNGQENRDQGYKETS